MVEYEPWKISPRKTERGQRCGWWNLVSQRSCHTKSTWWNWWVNILSIIPGDFLSDTPLNTRVVGKKFSPMMFTTGKCCCCCCWRLTELKDSELCLEFLHIATRLSAEPGRVDTGNNNNSPVPSSPRRMGNVFSMGIFPVATAGFICS